MGVWHSRPVLIAFQLVEVGKVNQTRNYIARGANLLLVELYTSMYAPFLS